jgi:hypothetical protein
VIEAKSKADDSSGPAAKENPHQQAEDMTAPEMFTARQENP